MAEDRDRVTTQVRWLVAGRFGLGARGTTLTLSRADFDEALAKRGLSVRATISDRVGTGDTRTVTLKIGSLKDFSLKHVLAAVPELGELLAKSEAIAKLKDPSVEDLETIVGPGKLFDALRAALEPPSPAPVGGAAEAGGGTDAIFEKAKVEERNVKTASDMFVRSGSSSAARSKPRPAARQLRDMVEQAAYGAAADVLRAPEVQAVEAAWRGLRFLLQECPREAGMRVILLETDPEHVADDLAARERAEHDIDEPDCIFVPHDYDATAPILALAELAEQEHVPIVVGASPALFSAAHPQALPDAFEAIERATGDELPEWAARWDELRTSEATRWICAVANRVALYGEGAGEAKRTLFGSGVWAVAAMLAASYRTTGGFARIFGKAGSLRAPASHVIDSGPYANTAAPTEAFYAIQPSELLAKNGILGLSSVRNSDTVALVKAPTVRAATDAVPLPAQILTGRVVRFARWVASQLPEGCDSKTANEIFTSAAGVFLFPGQEDAAHVRAETTNIGGEAHVLVRAAANPKIASIPFEIAFPLPLGWSVPAPASDGEPPSPTAAAPEKTADAGEEKGVGEEGGVGLASSSVGFDVGIAKKDE